MDGTNSEMSTSVNSEASYDIDIVKHHDGKGPFKYCIITQNDENAYAVCSRSDLRRVTCTIFRKMSKKSRGGGCFGQGKQF